MVAGTAPPSRMIRSTSVAIATFCGYGMPWLMIVLSSATTGRPAASASRTSSVSASAGCGFVRAGRRCQWCSSVYQGLQSRGAGTRRTADSSSRAVRSGRTVCVLSKVSAAAAWP